MNKTFAIIVFIVSITLMVLAIGANAQNVKQDANGNYVAVKATDSTGAKPTGKTYTDAKGNTYPVMISKNGKLFVVRTSKTGKKYNQYLKVDQPKEDVYYKLYLYDDAMHVMDGNRLVVKLPYDSSQLSKAMLKDNE